MYERFTDRARKVMQLANQEAQRFQHNYIGTEHILLGLVKEGSGLGVYVLKNLGVEPRTITREVERLILSGCPPADTGKTPQTPRAKKVIEYAMRESRDFNDKLVGTEHILLGLLREDVGLAAQVLMNLGLRLDRVRAEIQATLQRAEAEGSTAYSPQSRIRWVYDETKRHEYPVDDETKRRVCQLAEAIAPLQEATEDAVASQDFEQAVKVRDKRDQYWKELGSLNVPEWVFKNVKRLVSAWPTKASRFPLLDMLHGEAGEADPSVLSVLPNPLMPPVKIVVGTVPRFPVSILETVLASDDICSPFFQALVPLISPESVAQRKGNHMEMTRFAFYEIDRAEDPIWGRPVLLCIVRPTLLPQDVRDEVFAGLHRTNCDFVVFEAGAEAHSLLGKLPSGTKLLEF